MQCSAESVRSKVIAAGLLLPKKHAMTKATFNIFYMLATTINKNTHISDTGKVENISSSLHILFNC